MKRTRLIPSLLLGASLVLAPAALRAQEHAAPAHAGSHEAQPAPGHEAQPAPGHEAKPEGHDAKPEGHGAKSEGHEAPHGEGHGEGHGGGHEGGHHGPVIHLFGAAGGPVIGTLAQFLLGTLNFLVFAGILAYVLVGKAKAAFKARAEELQAALSQAEKDKAEGEAQIRELEAKMAGLQGELDGILGKADADAQAEKQRILEAARAEADAIVAHAQTEIGHQQRQAEQELRALVTELAVEGATQRLQAQMQAGAAESVMDRAIQQVGGVQ